MPDQTANRLKKNIPEILKRWEKRTWSEVKASNHQETLALRDSLPEYLSKMAEALLGSIIRTDESRLKDRIEITRIGKKHGNNRAFSLNYTIDQLIMEYHILRQVICDVMDKEKLLTLVERELITCAIEQAVNDAATEFSDTVKEINLKANQEEELRKTIRTRDEFLSIVSHELKTPLTSLKLKSQLLLKRDGDQDETQINKFLKFPEFVSLQVNRMSHLIEDILDFGRIRTGSYKLEFRTKNICKVILDVIEQAGPAFKLFRLSPPELLFAEDAIVSIDEERIKQVIKNLLTNAIRFGQCKPVQIEVVINSAEVEVIVSDQGIGIKAQDQERIFKMFERAVTPSEVSGLGLGLYITKEIIIAHGGRVWVESEFGSGSTFHFALPKGRFQLVRHDLPKGGNRA